MADEVSAHPALNQVLMSLADSFTLEVTPREIRKQPGFLREVLPRGTKVYTTFLPNTPFADTVRAARSLVEDGLVPVPHIAARNVSDEDELDRMVGELADVGVRELLVIAGSLGKPRGSIHDSMQVLRSGVLDRRGIVRVGVAGHPEGNPDIGPDGLRGALLAKNQFAAKTDCEMYVLTQFCFAPEPIIAWERRIREEGNALPIQIGLPGLASPVTLVKFGLACGVGPSLKVLRKQSGGVLKLARKPVYYPDRTLVGLASSVRNDPASLIRGVHFFPFGAIGPTVGWVRNITRGRFEINDRRGKLAVTA